MKSKYLVEIMINNSFEWEVIALCDDREEAEDRLLKYFRDSANEGTQGHIREVVG